MSKLDTDSRNILLYRPEIDFVEPEAEKEIPKPVPEPIQLEEIQKERQEVKQLAKAVNVLATAVQVRVDKKAEDMVIKLDPKVNAVVIQAMRRRFPDEDPTQVTYTQYKCCKEGLRKKGEEIGKNSAISSDEVKKARDQLMGGEPFGQFGGFDTPEAKNGGLNPDFDRKTQVIDPLDIEEFEASMLKILVNALWKNWIKPGIPVPGLPDQLCKVPKEMQGMLDSLGVLSLG